MNDTAPRSMREQPILALGFRPFYLFAGVFAVLASPFWDAVNVGLLQSGGYPTGVTWHSHEMVISLLTLANLVYHLAYSGVLPFAFSRIATIADA